MSKTLILLLTVCLLSALAAGTACAANAHLEETWDGYTSGTTPYGKNNGWDWELKNGDWMGLNGPAQSGTQSYSIGEGQTSQVMYAIDVTGSDHIAVQGWLHDSGASSNTWLGLGNDATQNNSLVRIGTNNSLEYQVQWGMFFEGSGINTMSTTLPIEAGWHYTRLDIVNTNYLGFWRCDWLIDSADRTVRKTGSFSWFFDRTSANRVVLGSDMPTEGAVSWDSLKVGSYDFVGPALPVPEPGSLLALGAGLVGLAGMIRKRRA